MVEGPEQEDTTVVFWLDDPNSLLDPASAWQWFPQESLCLEAKLNALTRLVVLLTILGYVLTQNVWILVSGALSLVAIAGFYTMSMEGTAKKTTSKESQEFREEGFETEANGLGLGVEDKGALFDVPTDMNPMSNVLLTDYTTNPTKRPAPPSQPTPQQTNLVKSAIQKMNPTNPYLDERLFMGTGDRLEFDQSMRSFYSTANTTIPNDQKGFSDFCYGSMVSCKEGNAFACARNLVNTELI